MSTAAQQQANKENARHSTGPRTPEGKQRSSQNALKHGFCSKDPLIRGEDPDKFLEHGAELYLSLSPVTPLEEDLVEQIIDITWRLQTFPAHRVVHHQRPLRRGRRAAVKPRQRPERSARQRAVAARKSRLP